MSGAMTRAGILMGALAAVTLATGVQAAEDLSGKLILQGTGAIVDDDTAAFEDRVGVPEPVFGGIEAFEIERPWGEDGKLSFEGRALVDAGDYLGKLNLELPGIGFIDAGYEQFRNFYDVTGNFFPGGDGVFLATPGGDNDHIDRGRAWFRAGLRRDNVPELTVAYRYRYRDGSKPSLARGDVDAGLFGGGSGTRRIAASIWDVDERVHTVDAEVRHSLDANTHLGAGARYESSDVDNGRHMQRNTGDSTRMRWTTQRDRIRNDSWSLRGFGEHRMADDAVILSAMYSYADLSSDGDGSRIFGAKLNPLFDASFAARQAFDRGFLDLDTRADVEHHSAAVNLSTLPTEDLRILFQARLEADETDASAMYTDTLVTSDVGLPTDMNGFAVNSRSDETRLLQSVEMRYTGIETLALTVRAELEESDGDLAERSLADGVSTPVLDRLTRRDVFGQSYSMGFRWYPSTLANLSGGYEYARRDEDYDHPVDSTSNDPGSTNDLGSLDRYPAYIRSYDRETHRWYLRGNLRPTAKLRLGARYDFSMSDIETGKEDLAIIETASIDSHRAGLTATVSPIADGWIQGEIGRVWSETSTPVSDLTGAAGGLVADFDNDFWNLRLAAGKKLDERTDLEFLYNAILADNYDDLSPTSLGYGSDLREHQVSVGVAHRLNDDVRVRARYGFIDSDDDTFGGNNDFRGSVLQTSVELGF